MTITREEFKELVQLYREQWNEFMRLSDYYDVDIIGGAIFKSLDWIEEKLGLVDKDYRVLEELMVTGKVAVNPTPDGCGNMDWEWTNDLDKIYDYYLAPKAANN